LQGKPSITDYIKQKDDSSIRRVKGMYCEKCNRIIEANRCPVCNSRKVREPEAKDPCYLTEQDYISSGILEDILKQNNIPYLKKDVMGAGMAIKVGPMLERSRFYVPFEQLGNAMAIMEDLFSATEETEIADQ
jgi:hypothetical protein